MFTSSAVDRGSSTSWVNTKTIKLVLVASSEITRHKGEKAKIGWLGIRIMRPSGTTVSFLGLLFQ